MLTSHSGSRKSYFDAWNQSFYRIKIHIYIIWSNNKPTIKTFVSRQLSLTLHVGTKEMSNHQINQILTQHSPPSPHLSAVDREEERRASCESCCGYGAVSLAKQALPSLMCCFKARFLRALPAILIWEHVFEVREGGGWLKQETPRSAIPSHDSLPLSLRAGLRLRGPGWKKEEGRRRRSVWQRGGWDDHLVGLLRVHAHAHTHLAHSLTLYSLSFDMGCYCADSSGREAWLLLSWI